MDNVVDFSQITVSRGFFVRNDAPLVPFNHWPALEGDAYTCIGTYENSGSPVREALLQAIRAAKKRIFIAAFLIDDNELVEALLEAVDRLRGGVYVITNLDDKSLARGLEDLATNDAQDETPTEELRRKQFHNLTKRGIYVRGHESCHAKFMLVDSNVAVVGSANFNRNGFEYCGELDAIVRNPDEVRRLARLFAQLWYEGCTWEIPPGRTYTVSKRTPSAAPYKAVFPPLEPGNIIWTNGDDGNQSLLQSIHNVIQGSKKSLTLATYSICDMTGNTALLLDHLGAALARNVRIKLFIRQRNAYPRQAKELDILHQMGIDIYADSRNHAKAVSADGERALLFSANFDAKHGLDSGVEVGVYLPLRSASVALLDYYFEHAISNADTRYVFNPRQSELDGKLAARWCSACPLPKDIAIRCSIDDWRMFSDLTQNGPALFEKKEANCFVVHTPTGEYELVPEGETYALRHTPDTTVNTNDLLTSWLESPWRARGTGKSEPKGFLTSRITFHNK